MADLQSRLIANLRNQFGLLQAHNTALRLRIQRRGVLWDVDGTLAESWEAALACTRKVLTDAGFVSCSAEEYHLGCMYPTPQRLARHAGFEPGTSEFDAVGHRLGMAFDAIFIKMVSKDTTRVYEGIKVLLQELHRGNNNSTNMISQQKVEGPFLLGALTNAANAFAEAVLVSNDIRELFGTVHGADSAPKPKPHPDGLWQCARDLHLQPHECIYIGDSPSDAAAAAAAGMQSIGVAWGSHSLESLQASKFDVVVSSVEMLRKHIYA